MSLHIGSKNLQEFQYITTEKTGENGNIGLLKLNRPKALNALCDGLMNELVQGLDLFEKDKEIAAIVLTGSERAFAGNQNVEMKSTVILKSEIYQEITS